MPFLNDLALGWRVMDLLDQRPAPAIEQGVVLPQVSLLGWESMPAPGLLVKYHPPSDLIPHLCRRLTTRTGNVHTTVSRHVFRCRMSDRALTLQKRPPWPGRDQPMPRG
jgi:hypothetical protein